MKNSNYKYHLSDNKQVKKGTCPSCDKPKCFVYYLDVNNNKVGDEYGKCDRSDNCGYILYPPSEPQQNKWGEPRKTSQATEYKPSGIFKDPKVFEYYRLDKEILEDYKFDCKTNALFKYLTTIFDEKAVRRVFNIYGVGTTADGACAFFQFDNDRGIRTGKVIHYKPDGHRDKDKQIYWVHNKITSRYFVLEQCLYGESLIRKDNPIGIVESEKTAIIAKLHYPKMIWLATGGKQNFNLIGKSVRLLSGHKVVLFPDLQATDDWSNKANELKNRNPLIDMSVSNLLEEMATDEERKKGLDLADFIIKAQKEITK